MVTKCSEPNKFATPSIHKTTGPYPFLHNLEHTSPDNATRDYVGTRQPWYYSTKTHAP